MELEGKIIAVLPERGGISQRTNKEWKSQEYVLEYSDADSRFLRRCCFRVFGIDRLAQLAIKEGEMLRVSLDIDAHEYNGRWFNDVSAWKVERIDAASQPAADTQPTDQSVLSQQQPATPQQPSATPQQPAAKDPDGDLPF